MVYIHTRNLSFLVLIWPSPQLPFLLLSISISGAIISPVAQTVTWKSSGMFCFCKTRFCNVYLVAWRLLCNTQWPGNLSDPPVPAFWVQGLQACVTIPNLEIILSFACFPYTLCKWCCWLTGHQDCILNPPYSPQGLYALPVFPSIHPFPSLTGKPVYSLLFFTSHFFSFFLSIKDPEDVLKIDHT